MGRAFEVRKEAKAKTAAAKTKVYSKYGREIYVLAKNGSPDPQSNPDLKRIIEKAKKDQVPNDIIQRAIDKAKGAGGENFVPVVYEGFGQGDAQFIIETLTDNVNRTISQIRTILNKTGGKLGVSGSVSHQFAHEAVFKLPVQEDDVLSALLEADADIKDTAALENSTVVYAEIDKYGQVKSALTSAFPNIEFEIDEITYSALTLVELSTENQEKFDNMLAQLEELDDVQHIYHNVK